MAAKSANVSFEETNAAIQVLDKAGKKGSEGGVALRNTLAILSQGGFLPKDTQEELKKAGIDVLALGDKSKSLKERLEMLKPVLNYTAFTTFAGIASASFGAFKLSAVSAYRAVSTAIMNIPIVDWIVAAIAALISVGVYFWNTSVKFRAVFLLR